MNGMHATIDHRGNGQRDDLDVAGLELRLADIARESQRDPARRRVQVGADRHERRRSAARGRRGHGDAKAPKNSTTAKATPAKARGPKRGQAILCLAAALVAGVPLMAASAMKQTELQDTAWEKEHQADTSASATEAGTAASVATEPVAPPAVPQPEYVTEVPPAPADPAAGATPSS